MPVFSRIAAWIIAAALMFSGSVRPLSEDSAQDLLLARCTAGFELTGEDTLSSNDGDILRTEGQRGAGTAPGGTAAAEVRVWRFPGGSFVLLRRERTGVQLRFELPGELQVRWVEDGEWVTGTQAHDVTATLHVTLRSGDDVRSFVINPPKNYRSSIYGCIEELPAYAGSVSVVQKGSVAAFSIRVPEPPDGSWTDWALLSVPGTAVDWSSPTLESLWQRYDMTGMTRLTLDGCAYRVEGEYFPSGDNLYAYSPSMYVPNGMAQSGGSEAAYCLAVTMLDLARSRYDRTGFFPTASVSTWLQNAYGMRPGFFDTRFNTDTAWSYLKLSEKYGIREFGEVARSYTAYLMRHIRMFGVETESGILVPDYGESGRPTHVSLNHQLAQILYLWRVGTQESIETADIMLRGLEDLGESWIRPNGDLYYAWLPDGSFGMVDYPYLTYNDLYAVQEWLSENRGTRSEVLDTLMRSKRAWMNRNRITGYKE